MFSRAAPVSKKKLLRLGISGGRPNKQTLVPISQRQMNVFLLQGEAPGLAEVMEPAFLKLLGTRGSTLLSVSVMVSSLCASFEATHSLPNAKLRVSLPFSGGIRSF